MLLLIFSKDASPAQIVSPCFSPAFSFQLYFLLDRGNIRWGGGGGGVSIFARRCKPSGSDPLRKWTRSLNLGGLLLFYSGGVVVSPWKVGGFSSQYLATDVEYLHRISCDQSIHGDFTLEMAIRGNCITCEDIMVFLWKLLILSEEK